MKEAKDLLWTWLLPESPRAIDEKEWFRSGGKWIIFDSKEGIKRLAEELEPYIDSGEIQSAKYWNGDPSAINVYCLDREREKSWHTLKRLGAGNRKVWEYDYAWDKNVKRPVTFIYSWCSKFMTIFQSYGVKGSIKLMRELFRKE
jgi:hypothetical protein